MGQFRTGTVAYRDERLLVNGGRSDSVVPLLLPSVDELLSGTVVRPDGAARPSMEDQLLDAYNQGLAEGRAAGYSQARDELAQEQSRCRESVELLGGALEQLYTHAKTALEARESEIVSFALEVAREVVGFDPKLSAERVRHSVATALEKVEPELNICIRVHPSQVEIVNELLDSISSGIPPTPIVVADETVRGGGVIVTAGPITIDAQLQTAFDRLQRAFEDLRGDV
ncbi:MAG: FliH/SctL family protein [Acidimicrobiales bacterium]